MDFKRRGAETGTAFQEALNRTNEAYERLGRACITRKAIPGKYLIERGEKRRGLSLPSIQLAPIKGQARLASAKLSQHLKDNSDHDGRRFIPESKAEPDYGGVLAPGGRGIYFDAKTTRREVLDFDNLHAHQITYLERTAACGAVAGFLVEFSRRGEVYFLPIQILICWRDQSERKSLPYQFFADALSLAPAGKGMVLFDYLSAIQEQENRYGHDYSRFQLTTAHTRSKRKSATR
jgi:recombination protein U